VKRILGAILVALVVALIAATCTYTKPGIDYRYPDPVFQNYWVLWGAIFGLGMYLLFSLGFGNQWTRKPA
jgi:hypothetical protein